MSLPIVKNWQLNELRSLSLVDWYAPIFLMRTSHYPNNGALHLVAQKLTSEIKLPTVN